nr:ATP-binding cassette domain-containing protein [Marinicella sp. W31]MDC2876321.1 ATP-binding cassette domain-containing protein [Marinicella sp. W31]
MTMISTNRITVALSGRPVLNDVSLEAHAGELTAICGPNGSGKTTTLKAIAGDLKPDTGSVAINGTNIAALHPWQLAEVRGVLPQASNLAFPFTVTEVLRMGLSGRSHRDGNKDRQTMARALKAVDLNGFEGRFIRSFQVGSSSASSLPACCARSRHQLPKVRHAGCCWMSPWQASTFSTSLPSCAWHKASAEPAAV